MGEVASEAERVILQVRDDPSALVRFDAEILSRGVSSVRAVRILLEQDHWEHAVGVTRQLFELLVNMEFLNSMEERWDGVNQYAHFGLLQYVLAQRRRADYDLSKGKSVDAEWAALLDEQLANAFPEFEGSPRADGSKRWVSSWCRKDTAALAKESKDPMRTVQYEILFRIWSEQAHAAPGALIDNLFRDDSDDWVERATKDNVQWTKDTIGFTISFFLGLWSVLPNVPKAPIQVREWMLRLRALMETS
jgi:hypothetical protein